MVDVIRSNKVKSKAAALEKNHKEQLQQRRRKLAEKLSAEQSAYEKEMVDREETPAQRMDKMAVRAYELKKRREDERKTFVQEKLYQQWRSGIDDLRSMDSKIVELRTVADRDYQLDEKAAVKAEEKAHDEFYNRIWHEGYLAKIEREEREKALKHERNDQQVKTLAVQMEMKDQNTQKEREQEELLAQEMNKVWKAQEEEEKAAAVRERILAKAERKKADEYMAIQQAHRTEDDRLEREFDKQFIEGVLNRERKLAKIEEEERRKAKQKAVEFTEALKIEMARKAESEEVLIRMQHEESEKQWAKRYAKWEKEEYARRKLMEDVYRGRSDQVQLKSEMRSKLKEELEKERLGVEQDIKQQEIESKEREENDKIAQRQHQEELYRQMDFHQVQRHRQLQQHAIEQRQAAIAEEKIRRAVQGEKERSNQIMKEITVKRQAKNQSSTGPIAPWDR